MKTAVIIWRAREGGNPKETLDKWLSENSGINIKYIAQSESGDVIASRRITWTIFYDEN